MNDVNETQRVNPTERRDRWRAGYRAGFTLVEVMLVAMIMGMMFVSVTKLMQAARKTRDTIHNFQETQLAGPAVLEMITRDLAGILTLNRERVRWLEIEDEIENGQDADQINFVTTTDSLVALPGQDPEDPPIRADVNEVGYVLRANPDNDEFLEIWRREDFGVDDEPLKGGQYTFLSNQVKAFNIEVFKEDGPDEDPIESWGPDSADPEAVGLPAFIRMTLTIELRPRIDRESLDFSGNDRRTIDYVRIVRFPERLHFEDGEIPRLGLPPAPGVAQGQGSGSQQQGAGGITGNETFMQSGGGQGSGRGGGGRGASKSDEGGR